MKLMQWVAAGSSVALTMSRSVEAVSPLSRWPLVMAHDAATTYLPDNSLLYGWVKTQRSGGFGKLAACGALALDVRPLLVPRTGRSNSSKLIMAHGVVQVDVELQKAIGDAAAWWAASDRSQPILLYLSHFRGLTPYTSSDAMSASLALLQNRSDVRILRGMEVDTVDVPSLLRQGQGLLVVLDEDVVENFDKKVVCFSLQPLFRCIGGFLSNQHVAFDRLREYLAFVSRQPLTPGKLQIHQAHWQTTGTADVVGQLVGWSSILDMSAKSKVNSWVLSQSLNSSAIQLLEVDDACDPAVGQIKTMLDAARAA